LHDIWNPWHGCRRCSEGCENCYMYFLDAQRGQDGGVIYRTGSGFRYPLSRDKSGPVSIREYLPEGQIEQVLCDGENYGGARPCHYEWVKQLHGECAEYNVTFVFCGTGRCFVKDGKAYRLEGSLQTEQAAKSGLSFPGKPIDFKLTDRLGCPIPEDQLYRPYFGDRCHRCGMRLCCNGCSRCGRCGVQTTRGKLE